MLIHNSKSVLENVSTEYDVVGIANDANMSYKLDKSSPGRTDILSIDLYSKC